MIRMKMFARGGLSIAAVALLAVTLAGHAWARGGPDQRKGPPNTPPGLAQAIQLKVLSSAPDQVTGGDVRIAIEAPPGQFNNVSLYLNGQLVDTSGMSRDKSRMEGVIDGLEIGENTLELHHRGAGRVQQITLRNHPITGPIFSGPQQQPFVCTVKSEFGIEPLVDSAEPPGFRVFDQAGTVVGYSTNCSIEPFITYHYLAIDGQGREVWRNWPTDGSVPENLLTKVTLDGDEVEMVVRVERGTINRFIYSYAMLVDPARIPEEPGSWDTSRWSGRLLYQFQGGVAIGHTQGRWSGGAAMDPTNLGLGYAIAYSTGNRTGEHYNLQVGGETALMTKEHFIKRYGVPTYTVGLGGSGGGIQQYVYAQNHPGLLDAVIPQVTYPDMVTQTIHIGDCELLEHFMDATDRLNPRWQVTKNRSLLVGLNATDLFGNPFALLQQAFGYAAAPGMTECVPAWRGLSPLALNPHYGQARNSQFWEPQADIAAIEWTHMDDLRNIYGIADDGFARRAVDNVGVQYGLRAFVDGEITAEEFLRVNAEVGGWKPSAELVQEALFPFLTQNPAAITGPQDFDPWSRRNIMLSEGGAPAPRHVGDLDAIRALWTSGMVFRGQIDIPVLDIRPYMEEILDMHNSHQSFAVRQRILNHLGNADHQAIWFASIGPALDGVKFDFTSHALGVMDEWMGKLLADPAGDVVVNRPAAAVDACFTDTGEVIASGAGVWGGILDDGPAGACTEAFPVYTTSRIEAGGPITGDVFKCHLKSVETALADGTYGGQGFTVEQVARLHEIFPDGVCDYSKPDMGRPEGL